jgi:hypothetical protein
LGHRIGPFVACETEILVLNAFKTGYN